MANPDYQSIGSLSPEAEATLTHQAGWDGIAGSPPAPDSSQTELQTTSFSRWNFHTNRQLLAATDENNFAADFLQNDGDADNVPAAGYGGALPRDEMPMAATDPGHFKQAPDGTISGADAALETSGNTGLQN